MMQNRLRTLMLAAAISLSFTALASAQTPAPADGAASSSMSASADANFVKMASAAGMAEVNLGKLGAEKGHSDAVKTFGQTMVDDHTKAGDELKTIASGKSIPVADAPMPADVKAASMIEKKEGAAFDTAFKTKMVADHEKVIKLFTKESTGGKDPELKAFATKTLPTLKHHLEMAKALPAGK
jgi:putative membrane protein